MIHSKNPTAQRHLFHVLISPVSSVKISALFYPLVSFTFRKKKRGERKNYESKNLEKFSGQDKGADYEAQTTMYKINKLQGYIVQHREYTQYFIITTSGV